MRTIGYAAAVAIAAFGASGARAQDTSAGIALTSDYLSSGISQTNGDPAVQVYVEHAFASGIYAGLWVSNVDLGADDVEFDLYVGFGNTVGNLTYDLSYYRYIYDATGNCCGDAFLYLGHAAGESVELGVEFKSDLEGSLFVTPQIAYDLGNGINAGALWQYDHNSAERFWQVSAGVAFDNGASVEVAWNDRTDADGILTLTLAFDTSLNGLFGR